MSEATISISADTRQMERAIRDTLSKNFKLTGLDTKSFAPALGKIKGQLGEFEKSLEASNARVVAFGASAGSIYLLTDAFKSMVKATIDVEKILADINTVINANEKDIKSFGDSIFNVANKTSQSFETAAEAALEFSRQGLGLEETAKRTSDALTLARLSGLSAAASVEALTAAVNSFSEAGLSTTQIVNKLAAVDAKYAVSSADLAEAIKRVGSSASEAGVNIDQLVALVTSAQQTTARGGAVIGNSFKTIFTRLQRPKVLEDLKELGIQTTSAYGETLPLVQILTQLARTFDTLGSAQRSQVAELVGGVYQINILKAVLGDLSKGYSTYSGALKTSSSATNEAEQRINKLGETLDSQINRVTNNLKRAGSVVGGLTIAPALEKVLGSVNGILETFSLGKEPENAGEKAAIGFLKGLGNFISGPGLLLGAVAAFQIFRRLAVFVGDAGKTVLGLGQAAKQQAEVQAQILAVLQRNPQIYAQIESGAVSVSEAAQGYLNIVNATNAALERQKSIASQMATILGPNTPSIKGSVGRPIKGKAAGYIPSISDQKKMEENDARALGAPSGVRAHFGKGTIGGKKFLMNNHEIEIPNFGTNGDSAVIPKYARGFISRFAAGDGSISLDQYMMSKYGMIKPLESLGGAALNAAYDKGVSLEEIRSKITGKDSWTRGGAEKARTQSRALKKAEGQKEHYRTYGYREIKLPWDKTLADFGGDPNAFGDAYEDYVAKKFGAKRGGRFLRANDFGAAGFDPVSKYNTTDIDFVVPKSLSDLSKGGTLIEARGGSSRNYNPSDIKKKFEKFFTRNPYLRGQKIDSKNWKRVLIAANAAGYIPRFAKGSKQKRRARYYRNNPRPLSLAPSGKEYTGELANLPAKPALKLAPRLTQEDLLAQRIAEAEAASKARQKQMVLSRNVKSPLPAPMSVSLQNAPASATPSGFFDREKRRAEAQQRLERARSSGRKLLSGGPKESTFDSSKALMASLALSQGLGMAQSFGLINEQSDFGKAATKGVELLNIGMTAKGLFSEYAPSIGKKFMGSRLGQSAVGRGVAGFAGRLGASSILGMSSLGLIGGAVGAGLLGREAIDYFGGGENKFLPSFLQGGSFGTRQIGKEQENVAKELARYKTAGGKAISSYLSASSSKYGFGNEELGGLRNEAVQRIAGELGGIENVSKLLKGSGAGTGKGSADAFTKTVISNLQMLGKEVADLADPANFGKAKDLAAGLISEVNKFEKLKTVSEILNKTSVQMSTLAGRASMMITVYRDLEKKERERGDALKKGFGGGAEGYFDPTKSADAMLNINKSLRTLNDPRLLGNQMERGRAAQQYLTSATEMGIDLPTKTREMLSKIMDIGLKQYQGQNLRSLMAIGGGYRNSFGLQAGVYRGFLGTTEAARRAGMTTEEYQLSQNQQAVEGGYLNRLQVGAMGMLGNPKVLKVFEETERRIKQAESDLSRLAQGVVTGKVSMQEFQKVSGAVQTASQLSEKSPMYAQTKALDAIDLAFQQLSQQSQVIAKFGEMFTGSNNLNLSGKVDVGLSEEAKKYLIIAEQNFNMNNKPEQNKPLPPQTVGPGAAFVNMGGIMPRS